MRASQLAYLTMMGYEMSWARFTVVEAHKNSSSDAKTHGILSGFLHVERP